MDIMTLVMPLSGFRQSGACSVTTDRRLQLIAIVAATLAITGLFVAMIRPFLLALFLAAIFSAMSAPLFRWVIGKTNRPRLASVLTLLILTAGVLTPSLWVVYVAAEQAADLTGSVVEFVEHVDADEYTLRAPAWLPFGEKLELAGSEIAAKLSELIGSMAKLLVSAVSAATKGTASFFLGLFIMIYAMFFFLQEKTNLVELTLRYSGLPAPVQQRLAHTVVSVSSATLKGTIVVSIVQGLLGGIGFAVAGVEGAAFWGVLMALLSMLPGIGPTLVWVPVVFYLFASGSPAAAVGVAIWSATVVGTIDNVLRPKLVGQETQMPDLLILISTLGGIAMFGGVGFIIGPVIAGLLISIWATLQEALGEELGPETASSSLQPER